MPQVSFLINIIESKENESRSINVKDVGLHGFHLQSSLVLGLGYKDNDIDAKIKFFFADKTPRNGLESISLRNLGPLSGGEVALGYTLIDKLLSIQLRGRYLKPRQAFEYVFIGSVDYFID